MQTYQQGIDRHPSCPQRTGVGRAFGTFGELLQGRLAEDETDFLVTFPIDLYSYATFQADPDSPDLSVFPGHKRKAAMLATLLLDYYGLPHRGKLIIESDLPTGKGLASSSADIVATARAITACFDRTLPLSLLEHFMRMIEPSDGVMYPGVVAFHHRQVRLRTFLGFLPPLTIISIDEGGEVDTISFNRQPKHFPASDKQEYQYLLDLITTAIHRQDIQTIGHVATRSAFLSQRHNPKQTLFDVMAVCQDIQGVGVAVTHSGTCLGILLSPAASNYHRQFEAAYHRLTALGGTVNIYHALNFR